MENICSDDIKKIIRIVADSNSNDKDSLTKKLATLISNEEYYYDNIVNRNNYVASILWNGDDLKKALKDSDMEASDEHLYTLACFREKIEDSGTEDGWDTMNGIIEYMKEEE